MMQWHVSTEPILYTLFDRGTIIGSHLNYHLDRRHALMNIMFMMAIAIIFKIAIATLKFH